MPNWCYNTLTITGKSKDIHKLIKQVKDDEHKFSFEKIIPMPESEKDNWYEWRVKNWGTKWNADVQYETLDQWENEEVFIEFNTAWSMPEPILLEVSKQHPKLYFEFRCYEESHAFWQVSDIQKGKYLSTSSGEFETCAEFNEFALTHHNCEICDEWFDECNNSDVREFVCSSCQDELDRTEAQLNEMDKELWEGELNEAKENAV